MKKNFTLRFLCALLAALMLSVLFCGCGDQEQPTPAESGSGPAAGTTPAPVETEPEPEFVFRDVNYGDETFVIYGVEEKYNMITNIFCDEYNGDSVQDAKYSASRLVEEKYHVKLQEYRAGWDAQKDEITRLCQSNDPTYDTAYLRSTHVAMLFTSGFLNNMYNLPDIDITKPWWDQKVREDGTLNNRVLYYLMSDAQLMGFEGTWCVYFNKELFDDRNLTYPYKTVQNQAWTLDELYRLAHEVASVNGSADPASYNPTGDTFYGMASFKSFINASLVGCNEMYCLKDADDLPYYAMGQSLTVADVAEKIAHLTSATADATYITTNSSGKHYSKDVFFSNRALMAAGELKEANANLAEMESPFGILPIPKYSADQENYISNMLWSTMLLTIPTFCTDVSRAAIIMDAYSYLSMRDVLPKYYERVCYKGLKDAESIQMLTIIRDSRYLNWGLAYGWLKPVEANINTMLNEGNANVMSLIQSTKREVENLMEATIAQIKSMG